MNTENISSSLPFALQLTFEQIQNMVLQLPSVYRRVLIESLLQKETETYYNPSLKGSVNPKQFATSQTENRTWADIEGAWQGEESDEEIIKALKDLS